MLCIVASFINMRAVRIASRRCVGSALLTSSSWSSSYRLLSSQASPAGPIQNVAVLGSGLMGSGIAQVAASRGFTVTLWDMNQSLVDGAKARIEKGVARVAAKQHASDTGALNAAVSSTMARINFTTDISLAAARPNLVVEAIIENLKIKQDMFAKLDKVAPPTTIFASNTSSLQIGLICNGTRPALFGGLHFFNPVPVMKLVEVVRTAQTSAATHAALRAFGEAMGKTCVDCKDTPGFIVNRLLVPYLVEAIRMLERGDASAEDIDLAMKLGAGYPMGPLALADYVGLDTIQFILKGWHESAPNEPSFVPCRSLDAMVKAGHLGIKSGKGFYTYPSKPQ